MVSFLFLETPPHFQMALKRRSLINLHPKGFVLQTLPDCMQQCNCTTIESKTHTSYKFTQHKEKLLEAFFPLKEKLSKLFCRKLSEAIYLYHEKGMMVCPILISHIIEIKTHSSQNIVRPSICNQGFKWKQLVWNEP